MRCSTTHAFGSGAVSRPPRRTLPLMLTCGVCAGSIEKPPSQNSSWLRRKLPEIFRIEILEVRLEGVGVERPTPGLDAAFAGVDGCELEQRFTRQNRRFQPQRQGYRIRRPRIDLNHRIAAVHMKLGEVRVVLHLR